MYLSGGHALLIDNHFVSAEQLDLVQDLSFNQCEYYSIKTSNFYEDVIIANGVFVESWDGYDKSNDDEHRFDPKYINSDGYRYLLNISH